MDRFLMSRASYEKIALAVSAVILGSAGWFWWGQLMEVFELLALAAG